MHKFLKAWTWNVYISYSSKLISKCLYLYTVLHCDWKIHLTHLGFYYQRNSRFFIIIFNSFGDERFEWCFFDIIVPKSQIFKGNNSFFWMGKISHNCILSWYAGCKSGYKWNKISVLCTCKTDQSFGVPNQLFFDD